MRGNVLNGNYRAREIKTKDMDLGLNFYLDDDITDSLAWAKRIDKIP